MGMVVECTDEGGQIFLWRALMPTRAQNRITPLHNSPRPRTTGYDVPDMKEVERRHHIATIPDHGDGWREPASVGPMLMLHVHPNRAGFLSHYAFHDALYPRPTGTWELGYIEALS